MNPASKASPAPVVPSPGTAVVAMSNWSGGSPADERSSRANTRAPRGPRLMTATLATSRRPSGACRPRSASASDSVASTTSGCSRVTTSRASRLPCASSGPTEARSTDTRTPRAPRDRASSTARTPALPSGSTSSEYAGRWMSSRPSNHSGLRSPAFICVAARRSATNERPPARNAGALPGRCTAAPAPPRPLARDPPPPDRAPALLAPRHERPAGPVPPDRAHELRAETQAREPARDVGGGPALPDLDPARDVRAALDRDRRHQDDVEHEVAQHENARGGRAYGARGGGGRHNANGSDAGSASRSRPGWIGTIPSE